MCKFRQIVLLFIVLIGSISLPSYAGVFDPVSEAKAGERCDLAKKLYTESRKDGTFTKNDVEELKKIATDKSDHCLMLSAMIFWCEYEDRESNKTKSEDSLLFLYKEALNFADSKGFEIEEAELTYQVGMKYYFMKQFPQAFEHLLKSYDKFKAVGYEKFPKMQTYLYNIGKVYYEFADYHKALPYLKQSLSYNFANDRASIHTYNILGLTYNMLKDDDTATYYYKKGLDVANQSKDSVWVGILSGNMANVFLKTGNADSAKPLILMDYRLSLRFRELGSAANCLLLLADINMGEDSLLAAAKRINEVEKLLNEVKTKNLMRDYFRTKARLAFLMGDFKNAYLFQDSFIIYKDRISAENDQNLLRNTEIKVQTEEYLSEIQLLEKDKKQERIFRNFLLVAAGFIIIIAYLIFYSQRQKRKKDNAILVLEKKRAEEELKNAENALQWYMNSLLEKNRLIDRFKEETEELKKKSVTVLSPENEKIMEKLYDATILTEEDWTNFKRMFEKVHGDFFVRLKNKYPDLTLAEIRLLALTKLNLSVNEIANMLGISPDSVRKTGSRMRKKLNLPTQTGLSDIASEI
jgi:DNA-binding CsgD family transcriptional regulator